MEEIEARRAEVWTQWTETLLGVEDLATFLGVYDHVSMMVKGAGFGLGVDVGVVTSFQAYDQLESSILELRKHRDRLQEAANDPDSSEDELAQPSTSQETTTIVGGSKRKIDSPTTRRKRYQRQKRRRASEASSSRGPAPQAPFAAALPAGSNTRTNAIDELRPMPRRHVIVFTSSDDEDEEEVRGTEEEMEVDSSE